MIVIKTQREPSYRLLLELIRRIRYENLYQEQKEIASKVYPK